VPGRPHGRRGDADGAGVIRVLLIGCGDVALRTADLLRGRARLYGLTRRPEDVSRLRAHGIVPIVGDLDRRATLERLRAAPFAVLHFAPPPSDGRDDPRTRRLVAALTRARSIPQRFVYISTSGVYGDCAGARVDEARPRRAQTPRAHRRVAAENRLRDWAKRHGVALAILRAPGIYTETRLPVERLKHGTPTLVPEDDVYTNHIHADDLARATLAALFRAKPNRAYNVTDDAEMKMGSWFDAVADAFHLPRAPRVTWEEAEQRIAPMLLSFMSESRRLVNTRMKRELRLALRYPDPKRLLDEIAPRDLRKQLALPL
jgi:nucleoside-diphosphate-sugar epimerase